MPCAKMDVRPREDPAAVGGRVDPIAHILLWRPSIPKAGDEFIFESKEAGSMVARRWWEGESQKQKTRKSTDKNGAAKRGQTADEEKNKKLISWPRQASYLTCWFNKKQPCLSRSSYVVIFRIVRHLTSRSQTSIFCVTPYLECVSHSF